MLIDTLLYNIMKMFTNECVCKIQLFKSMISFSIFQYSMSFNYNLANVCYNYYLPMEGIGPIANNIDKYKTYK